MKKGVGSNISFRRLFFFWAGIIATIAYRIIVILEGNWIHISWYIGTIGFILYFGHRSHVQKKRMDLVKDNNLVKFVDGLKKVEKGKKDALNYLVKTAVTSKSRWNSLFIFWLSVFALVVGIVYDFIL